MRFISIAFFAASMLICSCSTTTTPEDPRAQAELAFVETYAKVVTATYADALQGAKALHSALATLVANPTEINHATAKAAYIDARYPYEQSEAFRFYGGPIDGLDGPEGLMNGWPMDEAFVDYIASNPDAGIINRPDLYPTITKDLIESLNESGGETNISCGFHAIEFLLWGQDFSLATPGQRSFSDYIPSATGPGRNAARRGAYLLACADLLVQHLTDMVTAWDIARNGYGKEFLATPSASAKLAYTGVVRFALGELAGERMRVALLSTDQEDEHSCFSDQTHEDIVQGNQSIINVTSGFYMQSSGVLVSGRGLIDIVRVVDARVSDTIDVRMTAARVATMAIQAPFDNELKTSAGRERVNAAINAINALGGALQDGALKLGYVITLE
ncbi:MAG: hypothetical protein NTX15_05845 [Candidatus Kapabacteria bacterium]|nr:hypothetical protein [Candidatus Kapabacteria bacterium]